MTTLRILLLVERGVIVVAIGTLVGVACVGLANACVRILRKMLGWACR